MQRTEGQNSDTVEIKRERADSGDSSVDSLDSKRVRLDSCIQAHDESNSKGVVREDFLDILEEVVETEPQIQGLELVIRSLEEEINPTVPADLIDLVLNEPDQNPDMSTELQELAVLQGRWILSIMFFVHSTGKNVDSWILPSKSAWRQYAFFYLKESIRVQRLLTVARHLSNSLNNKLSYLSGFQCILSFAKTISQKHCQLAGGKGIRMKADIGYFQVFGMWWRMSGSHLDFMLAL